MVSTKSRAVLGGLILGLLAAYTGSANAQEFKLKAHHFLPPISNTHKNMLVPWADKIARESGGRIQIEIYPSMQLGGRPPHLAAQARDGVVDIVWTVAGYTPGRFVKTEVFELPFIHTNTIATNHAISEFILKHGDEFKGYKLLALHVHGGQAFHSIKPIRNVGDLKGLKIRTPTRTGGWLIEAMGATPIGAPVPKIPEMLSRKIVDAVLIPFEVSVPLKVAELVDYHTTLDDPKITRVNTTVFMFAMNRKKYDSLPKDLQKVIDNNSGAHTARWLGEIWDEAETLGQKIADASGELIKMAPPEVAKLRTMVEKSVIDRWVGDVAKRGIDGRALVAEARALIAKYSR